MRPLVSSCRIFSLRCVSPTSRLLYSASHRVHIRYCVISHVVSDGTDASRHDGAPRQQQQQQQLERCCGGVADKEALKQVRVFTLLWCEMCVLAGVDGKPFVTVLPINDASVAVISLAHWVFDNAFAWPGICINGQYIYIYIYIYILNECIGEVLRCHKIYCTILY